MRVMDDFGQRTCELLRYTCLVGDRAEQRRLIEPAHVHGPFDGVSIAAEDEPTGGRAHDGYTAKVEVRLEPAVDLHFTKACGVPLLERGEIHIGKPHRALDLPSLAPRQKHEVPVRFEALDAVHSRIRIGIGQEVDDLALTIPLHRGWLRLRHNSNLHRSFSEQRPEGPAVHWPPALSTPAGLPRPGRMPC